MTIKEPLIIVNRPTFINNPESAISLKLTHNIRIENVGFGSRKGCSAREFRTGSRSFHYVDPLGLMYRVRGVKG